MLKIQTKNGTLALSFESKNILIRISGGLDSATLLCALCDYITQAQLTGYQIIPVTASKIGNNQQNPAIDKRDLFSVAQSVIDYAKEKYPTVTIQPLEMIHAYNWWEEDDAIVQKQNEIVHDTLYKYDCWDDHMTYNGITMNPSHNVSDWEINPERHRQVPKTDGVVEGTVSVKVTYGEYKNLNEMQPFRNSDKRIVFSLGDILGVREDLERIAVSCEGTRGATENFTKKCIDVPHVDEICWWCFERQWAKENYDR